VEERVLNDEAAAKVAVRRQQCCTFLFFGSKLVPGVDQLVFFSVVSRMIDGVTNDPCMVENQEPVEDTGHVDRGCWRMLCSA
jgi:hypothetical protein